MKISNFWFICFWLTVCFLLLVPSAADNNIDSSLTHSIDNIDSSASDDDDSGAVNSEKLYTYDEIVKEIGKITDEYLDEIIQMRNLVPTSPLLDMNKDEYVEPARRRRRSSDHHYMPDFIRDGIRLISQIIPVEERICPNLGFVLDFKVIKFNYQKYAICLIKNNAGRNAVYYGPIGFVENSLVLDLLKPKKIFAFVSKKSGLEELVVLVVNSKQSIEEFAVKWLQINVKNEIVYNNNVKDLNRVSTELLAVWKRHNILILYDIYEQVLKLYKFVGTYFDLEQSILISSDLSALCAFTFNGVPYLVLGYKNHYNQMPKDITIMRYNQFSSNRLEKIQSIQTVEDVIGIKYFSLGYGTNQENFLAIVEKNYIVFYKFLKSKREFIVFQRLELRGIRKVITFGDAQRVFVMGAIMESNHVFFLTYNSLRFIYSNINIRVYATIQQPIDFYRISSDEPNTIQMMIGGHDGVRVYNVTFYHDNNLFKLWTEHLDWCRAKRNEVGELEKRATIVSHRFSEAYFDSDPLVIRGTLSVPAYKGQIQTKNYLQQSSNFALNANYFRKLVEMEQVLKQIDQNVNTGFNRLLDAFQLNSNQVQQVVGNFSFHNMRIIEYNGNRGENFPYMPLYPATINLITDYLNGQNIRYLMAETISIRNNEVKLLNPIHFKSMDLTHSSYSMQINGLVNGAYNMSDIVTSNRNHWITGRKRFHKCLIVDESIFTNRVNGKLFSKETVLITTGDQYIRNPVWIHSNLLRTNLLSAKMVNGIQMSEFFANVVYKNSHISLTMPLAFQNGLDVYNLIIESGGRLNNENIDNLMKEVLWINQPNQTIYGDYFFEHDVTISGNLFVNRINNKNIPEDLVLANQNNLIEGNKIFKSSVFIHSMNVTNSLNDLKIIDGIPDILISHIPQNITGKKVLQSLSIQNNSYILGLMNGMNIDELDRQSKHRPKVQHYDNLYIENFANFEGGIWFDHINHISQKNFDQLMQNSLSINEQWTNLEFDRVHFDDLRVDVLDCDTINKLNLDGHLLTKTTSQTISAPYIFNDIVLEDQSSIYSINNFSMSNLDRIFQTYGNQVVNGTKVIVGDVYLNKLHTNSINDIPFHDIVFMDDINTRTIITGHKNFLTDDLIFDQLSVNEMNVNWINNINIDNMLKYSLKRTAFQYIPNHIRFNTLAVAKGEDFRSLMVNEVNVQQLKNDIVFATGETNLQNVTGFKSFTGTVNFNALEFSGLFDGITFWEMKYNWMVQNLTQKVFANFSIDDLTTNDVNIHDSRLNNINLDWMDSNVVWLDRKTVIHSGLEFFGNTLVYGNILLNGRLNQIDLKRDIVLANNYGMQTIRGKINMINNVTMMNNLDVNGFINGVNVEDLCYRAYRAIPNKPLVVNGNVTVVAPIKFESINGMVYSDLQSQALRHNLKNQQVTGKKIIETLVLNGPTVVNKYINDFNLDFLFQNYMSLTRDQDVEATIVLQDDQVFAGDVFVRDNFNIENGIINGMDVVHVDRHALKLYGDQNYDGNIHFETDVNVDLNLNTRWVNRFDTNYLMNKKRKVNVFLEETIFTQTLNVLDNVNIVQGKKVSGVNIERMVKDAVLRNSGRNYTVYGSKVFDAVDVFVIHTRPVNNVVFSRENLLLKSYDQVVTGDKYLVGDVIVNTSVLVNTINGMGLNNLNEQLVKKSKHNLIRGKIRVKELTVNTAKVNALIDNVNISMLNTISSRVSTMKKLEREAKKAKTQYDVFEQNLQSIAPKLYFYDHYETISSMDLNLRRLEKPLLVSALFDTLYLFIAGEKPSHPNECHTVHVYSKLVSARFGEWRRQLVLFAPGPIKSLQKLDKSFVMTSSILRVSHDHVRECVLNNTHAHQKQHIGDRKASLLVQVFHMYTQTAQTTLVQTGVDIFEPHVYKPLVNLLWTTPTYLSITFGHSLSVMHVRSMDSNDNYISHIKNPILLDGEIKKVHSYKTTLVMVTHNKPYDTFQLNIFHFVPENLTKLQSIPMLNPNQLLVVENGANQIGDYTQFILVSEGKLFNNDRLVHVYATNNGQHYRKVQNIEQSSVKSMHRMYGKMDTSDPYVLMEVDNSIVIYRYLGLQGFQKYSQINTGENLRSIQATGQYATHHLALYFATSSHQNCDNDDYTSDSIDHSSFLHLLTPKYRQEITYGHRVTLQTTDEQYHHTSKIFDIVS